MALARMPDCSATQYSLQPGEICLPACPIPDMPELELEKFSCIPTFGGSSRTSRNPHCFIMPPESPGNESTCLIAAQAALPRLQPPASPTCCKPTPIVDMLQQQSQLAGQLLLPCTQSSLAAITEHRAQHYATCTRTQASV
ncbi:hypothetical protein Bbelb_360060 [Branchiostoma belcheri]|nr:hypothetical protein Bbelb_360060 [Branchiostoma belcheri]